MSRRRTLSAAEQLHADWLGMLRPEGLVVSVPVLLESDAYQRLGPEPRATLLSLCPDGRLDRPAFERLCRELLRWPENRQADAAALERFAVTLPDLGVVLRPDGALLDRDGEPLLYVSWTPGNLDAPSGDTRWPISIQGRFERLLMESQTAEGGCAIGLHASPDTLRLTYAPRGEAPGSLSFPIAALCAWDGRVLLDALWMLLGRDRLFTVPAAHRLPALLAASRKRQEAVTVSLAGQVEEALSILLTGVDLAHTRSRGRLLAELDGVAPLREGLVTALLRLVFLLYCEDSGVLPTDNPLYLDNYSLVGLVDKLEGDRVLTPEAMRHRYGAWARICALFRLVHRGVRHKELVLPPRDGALFDPDAHPWLEGRPTVHHAPDELPLIDDGVVLDVLERLVYLENQRLSYRNLDVEQIGSVYEALMGLELRRVSGRTLPLRGGGWLELGPAAESADPVKVVAEAMGVKDLSKRAPALAALRGPCELSALEAALAPLIDHERPARQAGQHAVVGGGERRRTGSHYTPTSLTRPIVERTLGPVLDREGPPSSERILSLKVCDPAMGSGAFLAEACRYLARRLLDAWTREARLPAHVRDRDPLLVARRMVVERCLYGVDKNPFAVQIARLSLWLVTLAKDQPFTFVDHALREGDAVIGLGAEAIAAFDLAGSGDQGELFTYAIRRSIKDAIRDRGNITAELPLIDYAGEYHYKRQYLGRALDEVALARQRGDLLLALSWAGGKGKEAKALAGRVRAAADATFRSDGERALTDEAEALLRGLPLRPFHWELEFPEVFGRSNGGFDAVVGNPPFGGQETIRQANGGADYIKLLQTLHPHAHGNSDLVAHFFLRTAAILRKDGCFGLVATNTVRQGQTRATGLQHIVQHGITLFDATLDQPWVGGAAVVVDIVHGIRGESPTGRTLNSSLSEDDELPDPLVLHERHRQNYEGSKIYGNGFLLTPEEAAQAIAENPGHAEVVRPYLGGEELNSNPPGPDGMVMVSRWVIDFGDRSLEEAEAWPELLAIARERVKPQRDAIKEAHGREVWWQFLRRRPEMYATIRPLGRCLANSQVSKHHLFAFQPTDRVFSHALNIFAFNDTLSFAILQSRVHEAWARHAGLGSTMKTDARYTPSTCFETFPFPRGSEAQRVAAAAAGQALDAQRTLCMRRFEEGMTKTWNRLLDPDARDPEILRLRELREAMDRAVLACYGWSELDPADTAAIVKRLRALNARRAAEEKRKG